MSSTQAQIQCFQLPNHFDTGTIINGSVAICMRNNISENITDTLKLLIESGSLIHE